MRLAWLYPKPNNRNTIPALDPAFLSDINAHLLSCLRYRFGGSTSLIVWYRPGAELPKMSEYRLAPLTTGIRQELHQKQL